MEIKHYDLFAGIGGFSLALDTIFHDQEIEHIFCEWEAFPTAVLKKHWPNGTYYGDIADLVADTTSERQQGQGEYQRPSNTEEDSLEEANTASGSDSTGVTTNSKCEGRTRKLRQTKGQHRLRDRGREDKDLTILTGGFPCQPFSVAGRRQGTADNRYLWPQMFRVIQNVRPDWVIAENVRGLVTWNDGMVLETVCTDLESQGYEVQPLIIPAVAIGAPHRRDRVWIVAHTVNSGQGRTKRSSDETQDSLPKEHREEDSSTGEFERAVGDGSSNKHVTNTRQQLRSEGSSEGMEADKTIGTTCSEADKREYQYSWAADWREVAFTTCYDGVDDGLPRRMDGATSRGRETDTISASLHRKLRLKACGNAIVPQVAMEIFESIRHVYN